MYSVYVSAVIASLLLTKLHPTISERVSSPVSLTVTNVPAIVGGEAELPCPTHTNTKNDSVMLIVWYIDIDPVYSYDTRLPESSAHWIDDPYISRAHWHSVPTSGLRLRDVQSRDRAVYRCRVDFYLSPTKNYRIALDVIELPNKPVIFDMYGKEISGTAGPYHEGSEFRFTCTVTGGYPVPKIQWLHDDIVLDTLSPAQDEAPSRSLSLVISNTTRAHLYATYSCTANNTSLAPPQTTSVKVDLYLKPLTVEITSREQPLSVGRKSELWCKTTGSRPPATLTWWLGAMKMNTIAIESEVAEGNTTESLLQWIPMKEHNGQMLTCKAENPNFNHSFIESKLPLNVFYMPESTINFGSQMNSNDIEEGGDVYFMCNVDANPPAYKVVWAYNGFQLQHSPSNGVIMTGNTNMALRNVSRHQAGDYTCTASNVEGDGKSKPLHMQVVYRPVCQDKEMKIKGTALQEPTTVVCEVDAFPPPDNFEWILNSSAGSVKINPDHFKVDAKVGRSVLTYTTTTDIDYGTLSCRATNVAGKQVSPCVYILLPVTVPDPPTNCTVYNLTDDSLDLSCVPGYDGGRKNIYIVEVWATDGLIMNSSNSRALWILRNIRPNRQLKILVYAANERGRSDYFSFTIETVLNLSSRRETEDAWDMSWAVGIFLVAAVTVAAILLLACIVTKIRYRYSDYEVTLATLKNQNVVAQRQNFQDADNKNPDLIRLNKDVIEVTPDPPSYTANIASKNTINSQNLVHTQLPISTQTRVHYSYDVQNDPGRSIANNVTRPHRDIVTTRTPLLGAHQESRV